MERVLELGMRYARREMGARARKIDECIMFSEYDPSIKTKSKRKKED
jgi:hypothetical protein